MSLTDWIQKLFNGKTRTDAQQNWLQPTFFGGYTLNNVYQSDFVNNAIDRVASEIAKIDVRSVVEKENSAAVQNDDITRLFRFGPNPIQTTSDFLACIEWIRLKFCNVFVYPQYDWVLDAYGRRTKKFNAFWVLKPVDFEVGTDEAGNVWEIKFLYSDGQEYILPYENLIHLKWRRGTNMFKGGGYDSGKNQTGDLLNTVNGLNSMLEGLPMAIENSMKVKGVYKAKSLLSTERQLEEQEKFESMIANAAKGIVVTDLATEFQPINSTVPVVSANNMKFMRSGITQRFGVSDALLNADYSSSQHSSFYQTAIEGFINDFEQEFSRKCFTQREQDVGHRIKGYYNMLVYMATTEKQEMARLATNVGLMSLNDIRAMWGLPPIVQGDRFVQSLNYVDTEIANKYQLGQAGKNMSMGGSSGGSNDMNEPIVTDDKPDEEGEEEDGTKTED